ncbi:helix-turn-helix transcriptional regulator [Promicromonospora vindobonensis]|uniref:Helix-turn-helix transcriptional regulator n=1 Tax=Promicromonospora vindobonensis TaxID=195748 RepID=A0ABW5VTM8_9MICO
MNSNTTSITDRLWSVQDVSAFLGVPVGTLYAWRSEGKGPDSRRIGKYVRYRPEDVRSWFAALPVGMAS